MTRHTKIIIAKTFSGNIESDPADTLAKQLYDTLNGKTVIALSVAKFGQNLAAVCVYDDA